MSSLQLPQLPVPHGDLVRYIADNPDAPISELLRPYRQYEAKLREKYAQSPDDETLNNPNLNTLPLFTDGNPDITIRARDPTTETEQERSRYIMALPQDQRRPQGSPAILKSLKEFQHNFNVFSESSLIDLDWSNVIAAGSSVVNCLVPVPERYNQSKRTLREFYHEKFCPASDVDLFLYGLNEEQAVEKIRKIEAAVRDGILTETTTVRTKNAITICSQYPTRHVQIVLRIYKNVSEILTGFDIDCSGAAYDGKQVYCTPRALQSFITQINHVDLSRRSPSYENRLSKYSHRGFEVYWPELDRSRIDPTIFERSFTRTLGLARLLVLERLPTSSAREQYLSKRREERGRPPLNRRFFRGLAGNIKEAHEDEVADWVNEEEVSNYHTFTIPYGEKFHAKKIEKLCYTRDLLLNAEWNQPEDRGVYLHRHPAFFGRFEDVVNDCCGFCPKPETTEELEMHEEESKIYVSGGITFIKDDPGRQTIGSFNPLTDDDWTEMAYIGNTARLCRDIVDGELEHVQDWLSQDSADPNTRDYTGRAPLHLAAMSSTPEVVKALVDAGARLVARLADGRTALHLAAERGDAEIVKILMDQSAANEVEEEEKQSQKETAKTPQFGKLPSVDKGSAEVDSEVEVVYDTESEEDEKSFTTGSFVKVKKEPDDARGHEDVVPEENEDDPDIYDVDVIAWDRPTSALHLAIVCGHEEVVKLLCQEYGADILLPVKFKSSDNSATAALLTLVLAVKLPLAKAKSMARTLLSLGATCAQADRDGVTAFERLVEQNASALIDLVVEADKIGVQNSINHISIPAYHSMTWPLQRAIDRGDARLVLQLLEAGAVPQIDFDTWLKAMKQSCMESMLRGSHENNMKLFEARTEQPLVLALQSPDPSVALELIKYGANVNTITAASREALHNGWTGHNTATVLDLCREQLRKLREFKPAVYERPELHYGMDEALSKFEKGTWQHAVVKQSCDGLNKANRLKLKRYEDDKARRLRDGVEKGIKLKQDAINSAIATLEEVEKQLLAKNAHTFEELHPDYKRQQSNNRYRSRHWKQSFEFKASFDILEANDVTESRKDKYIELFESAWIGDLDKIKSLTLASWGPANNEPPLQIAVKCFETSPFSVAYFRGHYDVAKAIMAIAQAQYAPEEKARARYRIANDGEENSHDEDTSNKPNIHEEIVDDQYTINNIGQVSMQVKSRVKPITMLNWNLLVPSNYGDWLGGEIFGDCKRCLLDHAIIANDRKAFNFYYDLATHHAAETKDDDENEVQFEPFSPFAFDLAVTNGRIEILADMIKWEGAGLPLGQFVKKTGVELQVKPRYYPGLTVYGKKRNDWASAGRRVVSISPMYSGTPPLLQAAMHGCVESVEWFLSDAPYRLYLEFGKSRKAREDARLKHINQSVGGFERAVAKWLGSQNDLVIHAACIGPNNRKTERLVEFLIKAYPSSLEARTAGGLTPLLVATWLGRLNLVRILIANGADQSVKDTRGDNILHLALANSYHSGASQLRELINLLDPTLRDHLFKERSSLQFHDGRTPFHRWVGSRGSNGREWHMDQLRLLLEFSDVETLDVLDGQGDTPLHTLIREEEHLDIIYEILKTHPPLLHRENAVGRTPFEVAHDKYVETCVQPPSASRHWYRTPDSAVLSLLDESPVYFFQEAEKKANGNDHGRGAAPASQRRFGAGYRRKGAGASLPRTFKIYDLITEFAEKDQSGKRRLVSLHEANDVATRIGEQYQGQRYGFKAQSRNQLRRLRRARGGLDLPDEEVGDGQDGSDIIAYKMYSMNHVSWGQPEEDGDDAEEAF